jgi:hypothetical protein
MAAHSRGSVKVLVQPLKLSLEAIATLAFFRSFGQDLEQQLGTTTDTRTEHTDIGMPSCRALLFMHN